MSKTMEIHDDECFCVKDEIHNRPLRVERNHYRIHMIPGNPGLISFYQDFLHELGRELQGMPGCSFTIEGRSLGGFEVESKRQLPNSIGLGDQILHVEQSVFGERSEQTDQTKEKVILMGHSVGSFILLELLRRRNEASRIRDLSCDVVGGLCLFPTVVDIAKSPMGRKAAWLMNIPFLAVFVRIFANVVVALLPTAMLRLIVGGFTRFPYDGVACVVAFLQSRIGVKESLHMGRDELQQMTADRWDEEIWGPSSKTSLFFYWGHSDHWIANETRDQLIAIRGDKSDEIKASRHVMEIDNSGIPHDFCIREYYPCPYPWPTLLTLTRT